MKKIENVENDNCWGDFLWVRFRGWLFMILTLLSISLTLTITIYFGLKNDEIETESLRYCPHCGEDLLR